MRFRTVVVWNDLAVLVQHVEATPTGYSAEQVAADLRDELHGDPDGDDPRWQILDGRLLVEVR